MSHGLQVFDASGVKILEVSERLCRLITTFNYYLDAPTSDAQGFTATNYAVADIVNDGTWAVECVPDYTNDPNFIFYTSQGFQIHVSPQLQQMSPQIDIMAGYIRVKNTEVDYFGRNSLRKSGKMLVFRY